MRTEFAFRLLLESRRLEYQEYERFYKERGSGDRKWIEMLIPNKLTSIETVRVSNRSQCTPNILTMIFRDFY